MQLTGGSPCVLDLMQCSEVSDLVQSVQCSDKWSQWNWQKPHFFPLPTLAATHPSSAACDSSHFGCHASVANSTPASPMEHTSIHRLDGIFANCWHVPSSFWHWGHIWGSLSGLYFYVFGSLNSLAQRWIFPLKQELRFLLYFFSNQGVSCRYIGQEQLTHNTIRIQ